LVVNREIGAVEELLRVIAARRQAARLADLEGGLKRGDLVEVASEERDARSARDLSRESPHA